MPTIDPTKIHVESHFVPIYEQEKDFNEVMAEQLQRAPWLALALVLNGLVFFIIYLVADGEREVEEDVVIQMKPPEQVEIIEEEEEEEPEPEPEEVEETVEVTETEVTEVTETSEFEESEFDTTQKESAFDSNQWNSAVGLGGGAGGKYGGRGGGGRGGKGGGKATQVAVELGLKWLKDHQDANGSWDTDEFMKHDDSSRGPVCDGPGNPTHDVGNTGLALLAFLGDGSTLRTGPYKDVIKMGVKWLKEQQDPNRGLFGTNASHDFVYDHAIAAYAMAEAYGLSKARLLKRYAQNGINYLESHRNPYMVWRYQPQDNANDTSVTGWCVMAYESAKYFELQINPFALEMSATWFDQVADGTNGRHGYQQMGELSSRQSNDHAAKFPREKGEAMTAVALFCRYFMGQDPEEHPIMEKAADLLLSKPPVYNEADGSIDHYYWYYATYALYQAGGKAWKEWQKHLKDAIVEPQRKDGNFKGSWDPNGAWGHDGGRVYATALNVLTLEVYYRYGRLVR